jgi:hypothetical protein
MIQENELYYDKRTHRPYLALVVGSKLAFMRYTSLNLLKRGMCGMASHIENPKYDTLMTIDISKFAPVDNLGRQGYWNNPVFKIGFIGEGNCGNVFLLPNVLERIEEMRKKDNWTGEPSENLSPKVNMDTVGEKIVKAVNKTAKKKKKPVNKRPAGRSIPIPVNTPEAMKPTSDNIPNVKAVPKKVTKKLIKKPNKK